jgi:hypothetical protein
MKRRLLRFGKKKKSCPDQGHSIAVTIPWQIDVISCCVIGLFFIFSIITYAITTPRHR